MTPEQQIDEAETAETAEAESRQRGAFLRGDIYRLCRYFDQASKPVDEHDKVTVSAVWLHQLLSEKLAANRLRLAAKDVAEAAGYTVLTEEPT